jgi:hypothetical protein
MSQTSTQEAFRRLTLGGPVPLTAVPGTDDRGPYRPLLDGRTEALLRIGVLVALDAPQSSYRTAVDDAQRQGVLLEELLALLIVVADSVGSARVISAAPKIALAAGYDVEDALETRDAVGVDPLQTPGAS